MTHEFSVGDEVLITGNQSGREFNSSHGIIVAICERSYDYGILVQELLDAGIGHELFHNLGDGKMVSKREEIYFGSSPSSSRQKMMRTIGGFWFKVSKELSIIPNVKSYDPEQQPYNEDDI